MPDVLKALVDGVDEQLKGIIVEYAEKSDILVLAMEVMPDHVHLLLECPLGLSPISIVKGIKQTSSVHLRREFPQLRRLPTRWARGSFFETVGSASLDLTAPTPYGVGFLEKDATRPSLILPVRGWWCHRGGSCSPLAGRRTLRRMHACCATSRRKLYAPKHPLFSCGRWLPIFMRLMHSP